MNKKDPNTKKIIISLTTVTVLIIGIVSFYYFFPIFSRKTIASFYEQPSSSEHCNGNFIATLYIPPTTIYEDRKYIYTQGNCSNYYVKYDDGTEEIISEALKARRITIRDLDRFDIHYDKTEK